MLRDHKFNKVKRKTPSVIGQNTGRYQAGCEIMKFSKVHVVFCWSWCWCCESATVTVIALLMGMFSVCLSLCLFIISLCLSWKWLWSLSVGHTNSITAVLIETGWLLVGCVSLDTCFFMVEMFCCFILLNLYWANDIFYPLLINKAS